MERSVATSVMPGVSGFWPAAAKPLAALLALAVPVNALHLPIAQFDPSSGSTVVPGPDVAATVMRRNSKSLEHWARELQAQFEMASLPHRETFHSLFGSFTVPELHDAASLGDFIFGSFTAPELGSSASSSDFTLGSFSAPELHYGASSGDFILGSFSAPGPHYGASSGAFVFGSFSAPGLLYDAGSSPVIASLIADVGSLAGTLADGKSLPAVDSPASQTIPLANASAPESQVLPQLCVVNCSAAAMLSGSEGYKHEDGAVEVPTPPLLPMMIAGLLGIGLARRRS